MKASAALVFVPAILCVLCCGQGVSAAGYTFVPADNDRSCSGVCSAQGLTSASLKQSDGDLQTSVCEVNVTGQGRLSGYQEGGDSTCNVVIDSQLTTSSSYSCLCLSSDSTPGLAAAQGESCDASCGQRIEDLVGSPIATDASQTTYTCLPSSEIGQSNHFGYTSELDGGATICTAGADGSALASSEFSCFCTFAASQSSSSEETVPSSGSLSSVSESNQTDVTSVGG